MQEPREGARRRGVPRRLVLTASALLERRTSTYEVAEWRSLASIAAIVRSAYGLQPNIGLKHTSILDSRTIVPKDDWWRDRVKSFWCRSSHPLVCDAEWLVD